MQPTNLVPPNADRRLLFAGNSSVYLNSGSSQKIGPPGSPHLHVSIEVNLSGEDAATLLERFPEDPHRNIAQLIVNQLHAYASALRYSASHADLSQADLEDDEDEE